MVHLVFQRKYAAITYRADIKICDYKRIILKRQSADGGKIVILFSHPISPMLLEFPVQSSLWPATMFFVGDIVIEAHRR